MKSKKISPPARSSNTLSYSLSGSVPKGRSSVLQLSPGEQKKFGSHIVQTIALDEELAKSLRLDAVRLGSQNMLPETNVAIHDFAGDLGKGPTLQAGIAGVGWPITIAVTNTGEKDVLATFQIQALPQ